MHRQIFEDSHGHGAVIEAKMCIFGVKKASDERFCPSTA